MKNLWMFAGLLAFNTAQAGEPIDETRTVSAAATIVIKNIKGKVNVRGSATEQVHLTGTLGDGTRGLEVSDGGSRLTIEVKYPRDGHFVEDTVLDIDVPTGVTLQIETVSADVTVNDVDGELIQIETVSGNTEVSADPGHLDLESVSGDIEIRTTSDRIDMETVSGDIEGDDLNGELKIATVSGEVLISTQEAERAHFESVSGDLELELNLATGADIDIASLSGDVELAFKKGLSAEVTVSSFSGSIRSDQGEVKSARHGPQKSLSFRTGDGSGRVRIESFSGDVRIQTR